MFNVLTKAFTDLGRCVSPNLCYVCDGALIQRGQIACADCIKKLPYTTFHEQESNPFIDKFFGRLEIHAGASMLYFSKKGIAQRIVHQLKYNNRTQVGVDIGRHYGNILSSAPLFQNIDWIIPVPLHHKRQYYRGYNQSESFAQGLSETMDIPYRADLVIRTRATTTQTRKSRIERFANVDGAFQIEDPKAFQNKHILLVDDVLTTGATLEGCAQELTKISGLKLSMATIGFAYFQ